MITILLSGCNGRMGRAVVSMLEGNPDMSVVAGMDLAAGASPLFPVYDSFDKINETADVAIDFSHISLTPALLAYCVGKKLPLVLCTTGIAGDLEAQVADAAKTIPIFQSFNMSLGVSLMLALVRQAAKVLGSAYDVEIIEQHHNKKVDAPSGTAWMIAKAAASALPFEPEYVFDRTGEHRQRGRKEIGVHSIRGGAIVGEHQAMFIGPNETISVSHSAQSRELFADGAVRAAAYLAQNPQARIHNMDDLVHSLS